MEALATLDAAGGRLSIADGRVRVDVNVELPDLVWDTLAAHRDLLIGSLTRGQPLWDDSPIWPTRASERKEFPLPAGTDCCDRCGSTETSDQPIHGGQSIRRDCAACGRFRKFTIWHGVEMP
jgi:hypothetical protein